MKSGKVVLGMLAGAAVGALFGVLLAPEKGSQTRKQIIGKGQGYVDGLRDKFEGFLNSLGNKYEEVQDDAEAVYAKGKSKYEEAKKEVKNGSVSNLVS